MPAYFVTERKTETTTYTVEGESLADAVRRYRDFMEVGILATDDDSEHQIIGVRQMDGDDGMDVTEEWERIDSEHPKGLRISGTW